MPFQTSLHLPDAFEKEHWKDVGFEISRIHGATQYVCGFP
jgi:hypothetical protein